jgi:hypothetical protein
MLKVALDVIDNWLDIVEKCMPLTQSERTDIPLSIYRDVKNGKLQLITANDIKSIMKLLN